MPEPGKGPWSVYMLRCRDGSLYTGIALDVARRIRAHGEGRTGARYLRGRAPLELVARWQVGDRSLASRVESRIKRMSRADKEELVASPGEISLILADLDHGFADGRSA